ncbi:hypothetical protein KFL_001630090 [Klebsormidium nitens]|uniref:Uncharacterized protein n=1 Tax=Klebsormidium nitens TaxID=105231 RepID=A0A1Y1I3Q6_KLENI|nr:hypothetical protein KFL_001630090 [Klebsormidium nitens]|eukprot:GAQ83811.1 hypothetical protein KFL_001630090 [Klebsormidium nitens]
MAPNHGCSSTSDRGLHMMTWIHLGNAREVESWVNRGLSVAKDWSCSEHRVHIMVPEDAGIAHLYAARHARTPGSLEWLIYGLDRSSQLERGGKLDSAIHLLGPKDAPPEAGVLVPVFLAKHEEKTGEKQQEVPLKQLSTKIKLGSQLTSGPERQIGASPLLESSPELLAKDSDDDREGDDCLRNGASCQEETPQAVEEVSQHVDDARNPWT